MFKTTGPFGSSFRAETRSLPPAAVCIVGTAVTIDSDLCTERKICTLGYFDRTVNAPRMASLGGEGEKLLYVTHVAM